MLFNQSPLAEPSLTRPVYVTTSGTAIQIHPTSISTGFTTTISCNYTREPLEVNWGYIISPTGDALYNASVSQNFELHISEESTLVIKILELAGIILNKQGLVQIAGNEEGQIIAQQKTQQ